LTASGDERLLYEARMRPRIAVTAVAGGLLLLVASLIQLVGPHSNVNELTIGLIEEHKRFPLDLIANVVQAVAWVGIAFSLKFLFDSVRARNPRVNPAFGWIVTFGAVIISVAGIASAITIAIKAHQFVTTGDQTYAQANHLTSGPLLAALSYGNLLGLLAAAVGFVLVSLNAMRVGLLTRFMGYVGIFAGILFLFVVTPVPVVEAYWLVALGYMISGRWPTGIPPAWMTGRSEPWPSSASMREQRIRQKEGGRGAARGGGGGGGALGGGALGGGGLGGLFGRRPAPAASTPVPAEGSTDRTRSSTPKRKRKRRK
jgi:uncharacterized membrane protein YgcG